MLEIIKRTEEERKQEAEIKRLNSLTDSLQETLNVAMEKNQELELVIDALLGVEA